MDSVLVVIYTYIYIYMCVWLHARSAHLDCCYIYIYIYVLSCPVPSLSGPCPVSEFIAIAACGAACGAIVLVMELASAR